MKNTKLTSLILIVCASLAMTACVTTKSAESFEEPSMDNQVVHQAKRAKPVYATKDRNYYLDVRSDKQQHSLARINAALATGEAEPAENLARAYLVKDPGNMQALTALAVSLAMQHKYDLAAYYARRIEKDQPGHPVALNIRGLSVMFTVGNRITDFHRALALFHESFESDSYQIAAGLNLGHLHLELGSATQAQEAFSQVISRCNTCVDAHLGQGIAYSRLNNFENAQSSFDKALALSPSHPTALYYQALVRFNGFNDVAGARKYLDKIIDTQKNNIYLVERAQTALRKMNGEADREDRVAIAEEKNAKDAELLMISADFEDDTEEVPEED